MQERNIKFDWPFFADIQLIRALCYICNWTDQMIHQTALTFEKTEKCSSKKFLFRLELKVVNVEIVSAK